MDYNYDIKLFISYHTLSFSRIYKRIHLCKREWDYDGEHIHVLRPSRVTLLPATSRAMNDLSMSPCKVTQLPILAKYTIYT